MPVTVTSHGVTWNQAAQSQSPGSPRAAPGPAAAAAAPGGTAAESQAETRDSDRRDRDSDRRPGARSGSDRAAAVKLPGTD